MQTTLEGWKPTYTENRDACIEAERWLLEECPFKASGITTNSDIIAQILVLYLEHKARADGAQVLPDDSDC